MSILDDLKKQANAIKADLGAEKQLQEQREAFYRSDILPRLEYIYSWLFEMSEHLNLIRPDIKARYVIEQYGELPLLQQGGYRVSVDSRRDMKKLALTFECIGDGKVVQSIEGKRNIEQYVEYLRSTRMPFDRRNQSNNVGEVMRTEFEIELTVPVTFGFVANIEQGCIDVSMRNFEQLGIRKTSIRPADISEEFMDNMGRYILRERDDFYSLDISDAEREQIRSRLQQEQLRREQELLALEAREQVQQATQPGGRGKLLDSLKQLARRRTRT